MKDPDQNKNQKQKPQLFGAPLREGTVGGSNNRPGQTKKMRRRRAQKAKKARSTTGHAVVTPIPHIEVRQSTALKNVLEFTRALDPNQPSGLSKAVYRSFVEALSDS